MLDLFWVKTTSLSGHHSRFGTTCTQAICRNSRFLPFLPSIKESKEFKEKKRKEFFCLKTACAVSAGAPCATPATPAHCRIDFSYAKTTAGCTARGGGKVAAGALLVDHRHHGRRRLLWCWADSGCR